MTDVSLFDDDDEPEREAEKRALEAALARVEAGAGEEWNARARAALCQVARTNQEFIVDAVWDTGLTEPKNDNRAMGAVMRWGRTHGVIVGTGRVEKSTRVGCHNSLSEVVRSLIYEGSQ